MAEPAAGNLDRSRSTPSNMEEDSDSDSGAAQLSSLASSPPDASSSSPGYFPRPSNAVSLSSPSAAAATAAANGPVNRIDMDRCDEVETASSPLAKAHGQLHLVPPGDPDTGPSCLDKSGVDEQDCTLVPDTVTTHTSSADLVSTPPPASPKTTDGEFEDVTGDVGGVDYPPVESPDPLFLDVTSPQEGASNKGKQKQRAVSFHLPPEQQERGPGAAHAGSSREGIAAEPVPPVDFQPLQPGDPGWETSAGRPPVKLPIRFHDALGRNYLFPWDKAKTWEGMERLIQACFIHVDIVGPHVCRGHYDLMADTGLSFSSPNTGPVNIFDAPSTSSSPEGSSSIPPTSTPSPIVPDTNVPPSAPTPPTDSNPPLPPPPPPPPLHHQPFSPFLHQPSPIILPEVWEDIVLPGMLVKMSMWPLSPDIMSLHPLPPPPPPPPPVGAIGRGRGRGRGRGGPQVGMGGQHHHHHHHPPHNPHHPHHMGQPMPPAPPPNNWAMPGRPGIIVGRVLPRGKTRKRQEGP